MKPVAESLKQVLESKIFHPFTRLKICSGLKSGCARDYEGDLQGRLDLKISSKRSDHTFELDSRDSIKPWEVLSLKRSQPSKLR